MRPKDSVGVEESSFAKAEGFAFSTKSLAAAYNTDDMLDSLSSQTQ